MFIKSVIKKVLVTLITVSSILGWGGGGGGGGGGSESGDLCSKRVMPVL